LTRWVWQRPQFSGVRAEAQRRLLGDDGLVPREVTFTPLPCLISPRQPAFPISATGRTFLEAALVSRDNGSARLTGLSPAPAAPL
jgi:hypothetical protein